MPQLRGAPLQDGLRVCVPLGRQSSLPVHPAGREVPRHRHLGELHVQVVELLAHLGGAQQIGECFVEEAVQDPEAHMVFLLGFL